MDPTQTLEERRFDDYLAHLASVVGHYEVLRVGEAAPTLLWAPANNTTLSSVPWGLKRYIAEPDFDLIVLNLTSATTISGVAGAEGGYHYSVSLGAGLNNLLVPRGEFLSSLLGQALINNTNDSITHIPGGAGVTFHPSDWSGRTETSGSNTPGNPNYIWIYSTTDQSENGSSSAAFGGLAQDGPVESGNESRQVQAIFWVNVTTAGYGGLTSEGAELDDLFGGLVLNSTGNFTGNLLSVGPYLGTLGLPANVRTALANVSVLNSGAYASPRYQQPPAPPTWWQSAGSIVSNTLSGIATSATKDYSVVWNGIQAAAAYIGEAASWLSNHLGLGKLASQLVAGLKALASAMEWAWNQLLEFLKAAAQAILNAIVAPAERGVSTWATSINAPFSQAWNSENSSGVTLPEANAIGSALGGAPFLISLGIGTAVSIALTILTPLDIGPSFLVGILIGLVAGAVLTSSVVDRSLASLSSQSVQTLGGLINPLLDAPSSEWATIAAVVGLIGAGSEVPYSWYVLAQAYKVPGAPDIAADAAATMIVALASIFIGVLAVHAAAHTLLLFAFILACLALAAVSVHFFGTILRDLPSISTLGWIDFGLAATAFFGSAIDLGLNWNKVQQAL